MEPEPKILNKDRKDKMNKPKQPKSGTKTAHMLENSPHLRMAIIIWIHLTAE